MCWNAQTYGRQTSGDDVGDGAWRYRALPGWTAEGGGPCAGFGKHQGQGARPKFLCETGGGFWPSRDQRLCHLYGCYVDYQGAGGRSAFDGVDASYGFGIERVGSQTVDGFGGEGYEPAGAEKAGGLVDFSLVD